MDLDDDSDVDLLEYRAAYAGATGALLWRINDGTGTFSAPAPFEALGSSVVDRLPGVADLNADGKPDLVGAFINADEKRWFRNAGGGVFVTMPVVPGTASASFGRDYDVDQDGDQDLLFTGGSAGMLCALNTDGLGAFAPATEAADIPPVSFDMGDADNDGDLDLVITNQLGPFTSIYGYLQTAPGIFGSSMSPPAPAITPYGIAWLDMDGDGDVDPTASGGSLLYYPYNGSNDLLAGVNSGVQTGTLRAWNRIDLDEDGDMDLVAAAGGRLVWVEALAPGSFTIHFSSDVVATIEQMSIADIDSDGDPDFLVLTPDGRLQAWNEMEAGAFGTWHILYAEPDEPSDVEATDVDGDGDPDAVVAAPINGLIGWYANTDGSGAFGPFNLIRAEADSVLAIDAGDLDGDSDMDIVCAEAGSGLLNWLENNGDGTAWTVHALATGLSRPNTVRIIDLANDGDPDVVFTTHGDENFQVCWNNAGTLSAPASIGSIGAGPSSMDVADFNHDDQWDVVISAQGGTGTNDIVLFKGTPDGTAFEPMQMVIPDITNARQVWAQDVDEDTHVDLFYVHESNGRVSRLNGDGQGLFCCTTPMTATDLNIRKIEMGDFDNDGYYDMVAMRSGINGALYYHGQGGGSFDPGVPTITTTWVNGTDLTAFDKDTDGDLDLLMCNSGNDRVGTIENFYGSPYRISGSIFLDLDASGTLSGGDEPALFIPVVSAPYVSTPYTNPLGDYSLYLEEGAYTVSAPFVSPCWAISTGSTSYNEVLTPIQPAVSDRDFGYAVDCDSTVVSITRSNSSICSGLRAINFHLYNTGTTRPEGSLRVTLDQLTSFVSSTPPPTTQDGDTIWYDVDSLDYFGQLQVQVRVTGPGVDFIGDTMHFDARFFAEDDLGSPLGEFSTAWEQRVLCAYDPNDKAVEPAGAGSAGLIPIDTERLIYTVRFQNTGNDTATTVVIHDHLSTQFDLSSLQVLGWTHPFTLRIENDGEALFRFDNIMLPDSGADQLGSQGHVIFSITLLPGLSAGTVINNTAQIVFDLNPPIITNTTVNTLFDCALATAGISDIGNNILLASPGVHYQWSLNGVELEGATEQALVATENGAYTVVVTDTIGCTPTSPPFPFVITGTREPSTARILCYPDPFAQQITVMLPTEPAPGTSLELIDAQGRSVLRIPATSRSLVISGDGLPAGVFTLRCIGAGEVPLRTVRVVHLER